MSSSPRLASSWMVEDENDFEHGSCTSFCAGPGEVLCKCLPTRSKTPGTRSEKIADCVLRPGDFDLQETFRHGLPQQPTCLAYDVTHQLLAVGSEQGSVVILGKVGLEAHLDHGISMAVQQMLFIEDKSMLVTLCDNGILYFWDINHKQPFVTAKLEIGSRYQPTCMSWVGGSPRLMVGTNLGSVHAVDFSTFKVVGEPFLGERIPKQGLKYVGKVIDLALHPVDLTRLLIGYSEQVVLVTWNSGKKKSIRQYSYVDEGSPSLPVVTSVCWKEDDDHHFAVSYSNGVIQTFTAKPKSSNKPREKLSLHSRVSQVIPSHGRVHSFYLNQMPCLASSGSMVTNESISTQHSLVVYRKTKGVVNPMLLSYPDPVFDFLPIPQFPFAHADAKALAVLTEKELILHDLLADKAPVMSIPFALDIDLTPVTCIELCSNCPEDFVAKLQSFQTKIIDYSNSTRPWPLKGGERGSMPPIPSNDLVITGHMDGSVCFWHCSSVSMTFLFTINTFTHFKERSNGSDTPMDESVDLLSSESSVLDDNYFAIHLISMDVHAESLCVANGGGHVMLFDFLNMPPDFTASKVAANIQSIAVDFSSDFIFFAKTKQINLNKPITNDCWAFNKNSHGVFRMLQHCRCYLWEEQCRIRVVVTTIKYCSPLNLLVIGSDCGLAIVCTKTNTIRKMLCHPLSLLYVADPQSFEKQVSEQISGRPPALNGKQMKTSSKVRVVCDENHMPPMHLDIIQKRTQRAFRLRGELFPLLQTSFVTTAAMSSPEQKDLATITCLGLVKLCLRKANQFTMTLWVGTCSGDVVVYNVDTAEKIDLQASGIVLREGSKVNGFYFINEHGHQLVTPYSQRNNGSPAHKLEISSTRYAIISTQQSILSLKFPTKSAVGRTQFETQTLVRSGFFYNRDIPCLLNLTSMGEIMLHSVPKLKHLRTISYGPLVEPRALHTFHISGNAQGLYFCSPSQIQRISLSAHNGLNFPYCLPDLIATVSLSSNERRSPSTDSDFQLAQPALQSQRNHVSAVVSVISSLHQQNLEGMEPQREVDEQQIRHRRGLGSSEPVIADKQQSFMPGDQPVSIRYRFGSDLGSDSTFKSSTESLNMKLTDGEWSMVDQHTHIDFPLEKQEFSLVVN